MAPLAERSLVRTARARARAPLRTLQSTLGSFSGTASVVGFVFRNCATSKARIAVLRRERALLVIVDGGKSGDGVGLPQHDRRDLAADRPGADDVDLRGGDRRLSGAWLQDPLSRASSVSNSRRSRGPSASR